MDVSTPNLYPMRLVTKMTGLSADTIRAWERRHGAVSPSRTEGNTRRYTSREVRRLLLLREATRRGHSIGSIANLGARALERLLAEDQPGLEMLVGYASSSSRTVDELGQAYVSALCRYDGRTGLDLLLRCASRFDPRPLVEEVLVPVASEVDERWSVSSVGTSHRSLFVHHLHALVGAVGRRGRPADEDPRVIVAAEDRVVTEVVSLIAAVFLARSGVEPVLVGGGHGRAELDWALEMSQAQAVVLSGRSDRPEDKLSGLPVFVVAAPAPDWGALEAFADRLVRAEALDTTT